MFSLSVSSSRSVMSPVAPGRITKMGFSGRRPLATTIRPCSQTGVGAVICELPSLVVRCGDELLCGGAGTCCYLDGDAVACAIAGCDSIVCGTGLPACAADQVCCPHPVTTSVVSVCIDLCKSQVAGGCHSQLTTPDLCGLICSVFNQLDEECREASRIAFECQLNADPCSTTGCNDLLKDAEAQCPEIPDL